MTTRGHERVMVAIGVALLPTIMGVGACGDDTSGASAGDGVADVGADAGPDVAPDTGAGDTNASDTTPGDTAVSDTSTADTTAPDTSAPDTSAPDSTSPDTTSGGSLYVDPSSFVFSYVSPLSQSMTKQLTILNIGSAPLDIGAITWAAGSSDDFDIVLIPPLPKRLAPGKEVLLTVRFREIEGGVGTLHLVSNDPEHPTTVVTFSSHAKSTSATPEPCVALSPTRLDFGTLQRGQTRTLPATLSNCGTTAPLELESVTRSTFFFLQLSQEYQMTGLPALPTTLAPGASLPVEVTYTPTLAGLDGGYFAFATDDPNQPTIHLDVSGVGTEPPIEEIGLRVRIAWDTNDTDEDSHLIMPGGTFFDCFSDCYFGNPAPDWGTTGDWRDDPFLDVDDVDGYGPENINISEPMSGTYTFKVHYYADSHTGASQASSTTVEVWSYGQLIASFGPTSTASTNWTWDVFTVDWPAATVTPLGALWQVNPSTVSACGFHFP